ncbi:hypothetical protein N2152v2_001419 [Parachlorella kessleri]
MTRALGAVLLQFIRKQIQDRQRARVDPAQQGKQQLSIDPDEGTKPDLEGAVDGLTKAARLGVPLDPANAASKRKSYWALLIVGFALAVDYSMSLMSIQPLCYDLSAALWAPVFGWWSDHTSTFKQQVLTGAALNAAGNFVYAFTVLVDDWWMMLIARLVAGIGAATLGLGGSYLTKTTTLEERQLKLGRYRIVQNVARMVGPFVGYLFIALPDVSNDSSTGRKLFNWYTVPGWVAGFVVLVLLPLIWWWFSDPTEENEHLIHHEEHPEAVLQSTPEREARFKRLTASWLTLSFLTVFSAMAFYSNLFGLFAGQYHQVTSQTENWKTFIAVGIGAMVAAVAYRRAIKNFPKIADERVLVLVSAWLIFVVWMLTIPYKGKDWVPPPALYYAASGIMGFAGVISLTTMETWMSKKVTQYQDVVQDRVSSWLSAFYMAQSAGRFAGPLVIGAVTRLATPNGSVHVCTQFSQDYNTCTGPADEQCIILGAEYYVEGCILYNALVFYPIMAGLQLAVVLGMLVVIARHWSYSNQ